MAGSGFLAKPKRSEHQQLTNLEAQMLAEPPNLHHSIKQNELFPNRNKSWVDLYLLPQPPQTPLNDVVKLERVSSEGNSPDPRPTKIPRYKVEKFHQRDGGLSSGIVSSRQLASLYTSMKQDNIKDPFPVLFPDILGGGTPQNSHTTAIKSFRGRIRKRPKRFGSLSRTPSLSMNQSYWLHCETEPVPTDDISLRIGSGGKIKLWKKGTVLTFNMDSDSFLDVDEKVHQYARESLIQAAGTFNEFGLGVTLQYVDNSESAVFQLAYSDDAPDGLSRTYAKSFFPGATSTKRKLYVYALSFESSTIDYLINIFHHEIGHILGLRHELAHVKEHDTSVRFGPRNPKSVMNSSEPSNLYVHDMDKMWLKKLYTYEKLVYKHLPIVYITAQ